MPLQVLHACPGSARHQHPARPRRTRGRRGRRRRQRQRCAVPFFLFSPFSAFLAAGVRACKRITHVVLGATGHPPSWVWGGEIRWRAVWRQRPLKPGLEPEPSPSPARAVDQGRAPSFREPEPYKAEPKPGLLSPARPCKSRPKHSTRSGAVSHTQPIAFTFESLSHRVMPMDDVEWNASWH